MAVDGSLQQRVRSRSSWVTKATAASSSFLKPSGGEKRAIWDINVMIDHWGDEVNLKKAYAG